MARQRASRRCSVRRTLSSKRPGWLRFNSSRIVVPRKMRVRGQHWDDLALPHLRQRIDPRPPGRPACALARKSRSTLVASSAALAEPRSRRRHQLRGAPGVKLGLTAASDKHIRPLFRETLSGRESDAGATAGNNCDFAFQFPGHDILRWIRR